MPTPATSTAAATAALASSPFFQQNNPNISSLSVTRATRIPRATTLGRSRSIGILCQVAISPDVSSSPSSPLSGEELEAASKAGKRIKVKVPLKVYHVPKAPDLDLNGMEGVIKQYVGVWKGKRISANLPFKVEFFVDVEGQEKPVRFFAHLREDEFDYLEEDAA